MKLLLKTTALILGLLLLGSSCQKIELEDDGHHHHHDDGHTHGDGTMTSPIHCHWHYIIAPPQCGKDIADEDVWVDIEIDIDVTYADECLMDAKEIVIRAYPVGDATDNLEVIGASEHDYITSNSDLICSLPAKAGQVFVRWIVDSDGYLSFRILNPTAYNDGLNYNIWIDGHKIYDQDQQCSFN